MIDPLYGISLLIRAGRETSGAVSIEVAVTEEEGEFASFLMGRGVKKEMERDHSFVMMLEGLNGEQWPPEECGRGKCMLASLHLANSSSIQERYSLLRIAREIRSSSLTRG